MLKFRNLSTLILLMAGLMNISFAFEKVGTTSFQFLKVMNDAQSTALGESYSSVVNNSNAMFWNPAALTSISGTTDFSVSHTDWFMDVKHFAVSGAIKTKNLGTFGFSAILVEMGTIEETTVEQLGFQGDIYNPGLTGETLTLGAQVFGLGYAKRLTDKFSFGLVSKFATEDLYYEKMSNVNFDLGLLYKTGYRSIKIAAVVRHFGSEIKYLDKSYPLPQTFNIGFSADLIGPGESIVKQSDDHKLLFTFDLIHPRDYDQQYGIGVEYALKDVLFLRSGYKINYDEEGLCLGIGFKLKNYCVDYSYNDYGEYLGFVNRFSIGFILP